MPNAFISYSSKDEDMAKQLHSVLSKAGIDAFMAAISIEPGNNWTDAIFKSLSESNWVFFLATKSACESQAVQQELGASLVTKKTIIPVLIDISPEDLPGWLDRYQAIDMSKAPEILHSTIEKISNKIQVDKFWSGVLVGALVVFFIMAVIKNKNSLEWNT